MAKFKHIDEIIKNNPREEQVEYTPNAFELIDETIQLRAAKSLYVLENAHFKNDVRINICTNSEVEIKNCTFDGYLIINPQAQDGLTEIVVRLYKVLVNHRINFLRVANYVEANIDCCVASSVNFFDDNVDFVRIHRSEIDEVYFEGTNVQKISITRSFIKRISNYDLISSSIYIDLESILNHYGKFKNIKVDDFVDYKVIHEHKSKIKEYKKYIKSKESLNPSKTFSEFKADVLNNISLANRSIVNHNKSARSQYLKYIQLIMKSKDESIDDSVISELNYLYFKNKEYPCYIHFLLNSIGFFYRPSRAILSALLVIIGFGIVYYLMAHFGFRFLSYKELFSATKLLDVAGELIDSIYFSGITFFTIGYSDIIGAASKSIEPFRKITILIEAAMGIILTATILVSFMNKYLTKK